MNKFKVDDEIIVIAGKDKGRTGKIVKMVGEKVLVQGINMVKKAVKPNPNINEKGGLLDKEMPIHRSNIAHLNPRTNKADRIGYKTLNDGKKVRYFKSDNEVIDA